VAGSRQLAALGIDDTIDYRSLGLPASEVCVEESLATELILRLCGGRTLPFDRAAGSADGEVLLAVADQGESFSTFPAPPQLDPRSITAVGSSFAAVDEVTGDVLFSADGADWFVGVRAEEANRFTLATGDVQGQTMVIEPNANGWTSRLVNADGSTTVGRSVDRTRTCSRFRWLGALCHHKPPMGAGRRNAGMGGRHRRLDRVATAGL